MALFATLAHHPRLLKRWSAFGGLLLGGTLPACDWEVLILRTAANTGADYEWGHHLPLGRHVGLTDGATMSDSATTAADGAKLARRLLLVRAADELHVDNVIGDATWTSWLPSTTRPS